MYKRIVIKIGTNLLTEKLTTLKTNLISSIAQQIAKLKKQGQEIIIVTSGAIGAGSMELHIKKSRDLGIRQALAAVGQSTVMRAYHDAFNKSNITVAQILVTYDDFSDRKKYLNLRKTINTLLKLNVIPIINENDPLATDEIDASFGDNDKLSAMVASKVDADLLLMLSDIDGLYNKNPKKSNDAKIIKNVAIITREIEQAAGKSGSAFAIGGMITKIKAGQIVMESGCTMIICNGAKKDIIQKAIQGNEGTIFTAKEKLSGKERFIKFAKAKGKIRINECAVDVLQQGKASLLAVGIDGVEGSFHKNDIVNINNIAKAQVDFDADEIKALQGKKGRVIVKSENIVLK